LQRATLDAAYQQRTLWWDGFRHRQVTHWQKRAIQRGALASQFPELMSQWLPENPSPSTVPAGSLH